MATNDDDAKVKLLENGDAVGRPLISDDGLRLLRACFLLPPVLALIGLVAVIAGVYVVPPPQCTITPPEPGSVCLLTAVEYSYSLQAPKTLTLTAMLYPSLADLETLGLAGGLPQHWSSHVAGFPVTSEPGRRFDCDVTDEWARLDSTKRAQEQKQCDVNYGASLISVGNLMTYAAIGNLIFLSTCTLVFCMLRKYCGK